MLSFFRYFTIISLQNQTKKFNYPLPKNALSILPTSNGFGRSEDENVKSYRQTDSQTTPGDQKRTSELSAQMRQKGNVNNLNKAMDRMCWKMEDKICFMEIYYMTSKIEYLLIVTQIRHFLFSVKCHLQWRQQFSKKKLQILQIMLCRFSNDLFALKKSSFLHIENLTSN